jgi:outer membrane protein assembly factor BamE (lipoprotein component of BamABCDE complex)
MFMAETARCCSLLILCCIVLAGCVVVPVSYYTSDSRQNITDDILPQIVPGKSTRNEVFLQLGEPDDISSDERRVTYQWTKVKAIWAVGGYGSGAAGTIEKESLFVIEFDIDGIVSEKKLESRYKAGR